MLTIVPHWWLCVSPGEPAVCPIVGLAPPAPAVTRPARAAAWLYNFRVCGPHHFRLYYCRVYYFRVDGPLGDLVPAARAAAPR